MLFKEDPRFAFEFVRPDVFAAHMKTRGFILRKCKIATCLACHQMVFQKTEY